MNTKLALLLLASACNRPEPTSTYFTTRKELMHVLASQCGGYLPDEWLRGLRRARPPRYTYFCNAFVVGGMQRFAVDALGEDTPATTMKICELRFGPAVMTAPLDSFDFIRPWLSDPQAADHIIRAIGPVPVRNPDIPLLPPAMDVRTLVDGKYRVEVRMHTRYDASTSLIVDIDACERRPDEVFYEIERYDHPSAPAPTADH